jgi:hypothetical protein
MLQNQNIATAGDLPAPPVWTALLNQSFKGKTWNDAAIGTAPCFIMHQRNSRCISRFGSSYGDLIQAHEDSLRWFWQNAKVLASQSINPQTIPDQHR